MGVVYQSNPPLYGVRSVTKRTKQDVILWEAHRAQPMTVLDFRDFYDNVAFKDCQLKANDGTVLRCHTVIVAGASSVFEEILAADCQREAGTRTAQVAADGHILDLLVQFMYGKTVHVPVIDVMTVYQLTQQYGMCTAGHKLSNIIRHEIEGFDPQALCHILHQAYQLGDMAKQIVEQAVADFRRRMFDFGANYFTSIADFQQWPIGLLSLVLEEHPGRDIYYRRYSRVGMIRVTYAVSAAAWVNTATDNRMEHWEELLQQVKLDQLESREIQNIKDIYPNLLQMPGVEEAMQEAANLCSRCCK